jgi:hypothetical protein
MPRRKFETFANEDGPLDLSGQQSTASTACSVLLSFLFFAVAVAVLVVASVVLNIAIATRNSLTAHRGNVIVSTNCSDGRACTVDLLYQDTQHCENPNAVRHAACDTECYVDGTSTSCDGKGACTSTDWTACKSYCEMDSGLVLDIPPESDVNASIDLFPFKAFFRHNLTGPNVLSYEQYLEAPLAFGICLGNQYVFSTLMLNIIVRETNYLPVFMPSARMSCSDLLNQSVSLVQEGCLVSSEFYVDTQYVDYLMGSVFFEYYTGSPEPNTTTLHGTARGCIFHYSCGQFNETAFADEDLWTKRSVAEEGASLSFPHPSPLANHQIGQRLFQEGLREYLVGRLEKVKQRRRK